MIEQALLVAELDTALYQQKKQWYAVRLENGERIDCGRDLNAILTHPSEKRYLNPPPADLDALVTDLQLWSQRHQLLQCLLMGMDAILSAATRQQALAIAEQLLNRSELTGFAHARLLGCPLPTAADLDGAISLCAPYSQDRTLYCEIKQAQALIPAVRRVLENLPRFDFEIGGDVDELLPVMVDEGVIAEAVAAVSQQQRQQVNELLFKFSNNKSLKTLEPRIGALLTALIKQLLSQFSFINKEPAPQAVFLEVNGC